jgi:phasin
MTEATTGANNAKAAKHTASPFGVPNFEMPKFGFPKMEMPEAFREMAEQGAAHAKDNCEKIQAAAEEASELLKGAYTMAAKGATDYNLKIIELARSNANAAFDYVHNLLAVKSPSEFIELSTAHARKQFEAMTTQTKELTELAQKVTTEIAAKDWRHGDTKKSHKVA